MRLFGLTGFIVISILFLAWPISGYRYIQDNDGSSFLEENSAALTRNNKMRSRVRHRETRVTKHQSGKEDEDNESESDQAKEDKNSGDESESDQAIEAELDDLVPKTSPAQNMITSTTFPLTTTTAKVLPLDNGDGNAAKIFVFNPEGDQISFVPTADATAQLSAAVASACKSSHLPLDRKTTCFCQHGPLPKKRGLRVAAGATPAMLCHCERDHTPGVHDVAVKDSVARKSLLAQTKKIAERVLRRYSAQGARERMRSVITQQISQALRRTQAMREVKAESQKAFREAEARAASAGQEEVPGELEGLVENYREYQKLLQKGPQEEPPPVAKDRSDIKQLLVARVGAKQLQVVRLKQAIRLVKEIADMRAAKLAARDRDRSDHAKLYALLLAEFKKLLADMYNKTAAQMAASFADFLKLWRDKIASLKAQLGRLKGMLANVNGANDPRVAALEGMLKQLRERLDREQELYAKELRMHSSPCSSNAQCKLSQRCDQFACLGVALKSPCDTSGDCGMAQLCKSKRCVAMEPPPGSPCTTTADCGEGAKCSINKCVTVSAGSRCIAHADCAKGQLCEGRVCQWMRPPPGLPCVKNADGFDNCTIGQRCSSANKCEIVCEGSRCATRQDCSAGQGCVGLKCRFFNPPTGSPCSKTKECAVGHRCVNNVCDLRQSGTVCTKAEDCGFAQRCVRGLCRALDKQTSCTSHSECGNGQRCVGNSKNAAQCVGFSSRGRTCSDSADCPIFFKCSFGKCARVLQRTHCANAKQCGNHMLCLHFQCVPDVSFRGLKRPWLHPCKASKDCHDTRDCVEGLCVVVPHELGGCKKDKSCGNQQSCAANVCVPRYASGYVQHGGLCKHKDDCANGQVCQKQRCNDKAEGSPCKQTSDCGLSQQCLAGGCISDGASCLSDVHCFTFQTCLSGRCASVSLKSDCLAHSDCGNEQLCDLEGTPKRCQKAEPNLNEACSRDADCGLGMRCDDTKRKCLWVSVGSLCQTDGFILQGTGAIAGSPKPPPPCGNGQVCFVEQCAWTVPSEGSACTAAFDCGTDQNCVVDERNATVCSAIPQGSDCDDHADCGNGQRCKSKACVRASEVRRSRKHSQVPCKATSECGAREVCTTGHCVGQYHRGQDVPDGSPCASQSACGFGQKCSASMCRIVPRNSECKSSADCGNGRQCLQGTCLDTPAGTLCGSRFNDQDEVVQSLLDPKKPAAVIGGECGNHQICQFNRCRNLFGGHVSTAVAPGTKCLTHSECSFRQRCVRGLCELLHGEIKCTSNGDCGNGHLCKGVRPGRTGVCTVLPEGKRCTRSLTSFDQKDDYVPPDECGTCESCLLSKDQCSTKTSREKCSQQKAATWCGAPSSNDDATTGDTCANGQLCLGGSCKNQFGAVVPSHFVRGENSLAPNALLRAHWVPEGSLCSTNYGCGAAQVCGDDLHCSSVAEGSRCHLTENCGNGQRCVPGKYVCQAEREGSACNSAADCSKTSICMNTRCVYNFGHLVGMELARRAEEDWTLASEWRAKMSLSLKQALAAMEAQKKNNSYDMEMAQQLKQMQAEFAKLVAGTQVLEFEVNRRSNKLLTNSDVEGGGSTCALCVAEQDIQKLIDEIERLKGELKRCIQHPEAYIPSCKQDLKFQISKLKEEVIRRRALLEEEVMQLHEEEMKLVKQLNECRNRPNGCEQASEHRLLLQIMKAQDQLYRRKKKKLRDDQLLVLKCLWRARKSAAAETIAAQFKKSVADGCRQIESQTGPLRDCLCKQYFDEKKVSEEARARVQQANAAWKAATDNEASAQQRAEVERQRQKDVAIEVAKDLVWQAFKGNGDWKAQLQLIRDKNKDKVARMTDDARKKVDASNKPAPQLGDQIDLSKLEDCVAPITDAAVRTNVKSAFTEGPARNGCALLSLAKTQVLYTAYLCLCDASKLKK